MSQLLHWPSKYWFYPIGNTSAVSVTSDLPINEPARVLLLGCGDPRNILYSLFVEPDSSKRPIDFTCCDIDPAILARNILLFTMIIDDVPVEKIWKIFYHFRLDQDSKSTLLAQCAKLITASESHGQWRSSAYGQLLRMSTEYTLKEVRRHWNLYVSMDTLPQTRLDAIEAAFTKMSQENSTRSNQSILRSAGPLFTRIIYAALQSSQLYWKSGTTFSDTIDLNSATEINPTFVYSLGDEASCHYGTDPLVSFHLAAIINDIAGEPTVAQLVEGSKAQFRSWCAAYRSLISRRSPVVVRFIAGDAMPVCHAVHTFHVTGATKSGLPVSQWKAALVELDPHEYTDDDVGRSLASFNVVHASNLEDHIGLFNVLISAIPLMSPSPFSVLYTESLLHLISGNASKEFATRLKADLTTIGLLLDIAPVDYLTGYSTRCNTHELILGIIAPTVATASQFHQMTTWRSPASGDARARFPAPTPAFDADQLGSLLHDIYSSLFANETITNLWNENKRPKEFVKVIGTSNLVQYTRETFVLFLKLVRSRLRQTDEVWTAAMDYFMSLQVDAPPIWNEVLAIHMPSMDALHIQSFYGQLLFHGVHRPLQYTDAKPASGSQSQTGPFASWSKIPDLVRIIFLVPRLDLDALRSLAYDEIGTPPLQCDIFQSSGPARNKHHQIFTSMHVAFGRVTRVGDAAASSRPQVTFEEDVRGWEGSSPLVVTFIAPSWLLADSTSPSTHSKFNVGLSVQNTPAAVHLLAKKLGVDLRISATPITDTDRVFILPQSTLPTGVTTSAPSIVNDNNAAHWITVALGTGPLIESQIGGDASTATSITVQLDDECELVSSLTARVSITNPHTVERFCAPQSKLMPKVIQISPCVMRVVVGSKRQDLVYPFPVQGSAPRVRIARKSRYIEVVVPPSRAFLPGGMQLSPFPVFTTTAGPSPWSMPRVNLERLPILDLRPDKLTIWYEAHAGSILSMREKSIKKRGEKDILMYVKDSIHSIFIRAAGLQNSGAPKRLFSMIDHQTKNCDTVFFVDSIRIDVASHALVCDAYVLQISEERIAEIKQPFSRLLNLTPNKAHISAFEGEMAAWKQLLPALVERCRTTWTHTADCEYKIKGRVPLSTEADELPLCRCGEGNDVEGMMRNPLWAPLAPYVTRVAITPLFGVSYLESVVRQSRPRKCAGCEKTKAGMKRCGGCKRARYCSAECQKGHWDCHKVKCRGRVLEHLV